MRVSLARSRALFPSLRPQKLNELTPCAHTSSGMLPSARVSQVRSRVAGAELLSARPWAGPEDPSVCVGVGAYPTSTAVIVLFGVKLPNGHEPHVARACWGGTVSTCNDGDMLTLFVCLCQRATTVCLDGSSHRMSPPVQKRIADGWSPNVSSWGGSPVKGDDGKWHLFVSEIVNGCGLHYWETNSQCTHAVADTAEGPFTKVGVALGTVGHSEPASLIRGCPLCRRFRDVQARSGTVHRRPSAP